jgi:hypothetical protein
MSTALYDSACTEFGAAVYKLELLYDSRLRKTSKASHNSITIKHKKFETYILTQGATDAQLGYDLYNTATFYAHFGCGLH